MIPVITQNSACVVSAVAFESAPPAGGVTVRSFPLLRPYRRLHNNFLFEGEASRSGDHFLFLSVER